MVGLSPSYVLLWNLWIKDTLGPTISSFLERLSALQGFKLYSEIYDNKHLGLWTVSFVERLFLVCPLLGGSFISGSTVLYIFNSVNNATPSYTIVTVYVQSPHDHIILVWMIECQLCNPLYCISLSLMWL